MRRCVPAVLFAALLLTGRTAFAGSIAVGDTLHLVDAGGPPIWGGEFQVDDLSLPGLIDLLTFCVQHEQDINGDDEFRVADISGITDDGNALDDETAWIFYSKYAPGGLLSSYSDDQIQAAIWKIEQQTYFINNIFPSAALSQQDRDNADALIDAAHNAVLGGWMNNDRVMLLNLVFLNDTAEHFKDDPAQDLLVLTDGGLTTQAVETPEPATLLLVGTGAAGLIRRHFKRRRTP